MSEPCHPLTALVLAGGRARRLGGDKAERELHGRRLIDHVLEGARTVADAVLVLPGDRELPTGGIRCVPDAPGLAGPLAGLAGGLAAARPGWCLLLPCDLPFVSAPVVQRLLASAAPGDRAIIVEEDGRLQPFHGLYHTSLAASARDASHAGNRSLTGFLERIGARRIAADDLRDLDPTLRFLIDVDTPQDLARARGVKTV